MILCIYYLSVALSFATVTTEKSFSAINIIKIVYATLFGYKLHILRMMYSRLSTMKKSHTDFKI